MKSNWKHTAILVLVISALRGALVAKQIEQFEGTELLPKPLQRERLVETLAALGVEPPGAP